MVRVKDATVTTVAMAEKESWPDVMGRYVLKLNKQDVQLLISKRKRM